MYGLSTLIFAYKLWKGRKSGWAGTIIVSFCVIVIDLLTLLNTSLIPGVPRGAAPGEIAYSLAALLYLLQPKIIHVFK